MSARAWFLGTLLVLFGVLQFVPGVGVGNVYAVDMSWQQSPCYTSSATNFPATCNPQQAWEACQAARVWPAANDNVNHSTVSECQSYSAPAGKTSLYFTWNSNFGTPSTTRYFNSGASCPAGTSWNTTSHTCFDAARCLAKPAESIGILNVGMFGDKMCSDSCEFQAQGGTTSSLTTGAGATLSTYVGGAYKPTGAACAAGQGAAPPPKKQECVGVPGQTMCKRDDGKLCASASSGKQICWRPGETGEKGDGPLLQVRNAGSTPATPQTAPPPGDSFQQQGSPQGASESINGGPSIVTTVTNYTTTTGVNAVGGSTGSATGGSGDAGEPDDGSQGGGGGSGGDGASASGGETCDAPPMCSGDPVGCAALAQQYFARCESKALFSVEGADLDGSGGMMADASGLWSDGQAPGPLDDSGFLSAARSCPPPVTFVFLGESRTLDVDGMCDIAAVVAALVLLMAFAQAAWIIGEQ